MCVRLEIHMYISSASISIHSNVGGCVKNYIQSGVAIIDNCHLLSSVSVSLVHHNTHSFCLTFYKHFLLQITQIPSVNKPFKSLKAMINPTVQSTRSRALSLYRQLLRSAMKMPTPNRQQYVIRKTREEYRANMHITDSNEIDFLIRLADTNLDTVMVQAEHLTALFREESKNADL